MIIFNNLTLKKSVNKAYLKIKPVRNDFENFKCQLSKLFLLINKKESEEHNKIIKIVDRVLFSNSVKDTSKLKSEIDEIVYKLYGLTEEEIKIVEGK